MAVMGSDAVYDPTEALCELIVLLWEQLVVATAVLNDTYFDLPDHRANNIKLRIENQSLSILVFDPIEENLHLEDKLNGFSVNNSTCNGHCNFPSDTDSDSNVLNTEYSEYRIILYSYIL